MQELQLCNTAMDELLCFEIFRFATITHRPIYKSWNIN